MQSSSATIEKKLEISILYVEDEESIRGALSRLLERRFSEVITAENGAEGILRYVQKRPDIVITDIKMPEMNGLEMIRKIRAINPEALIIITTAFTDPDYLLEAIKLGVNRCILKPIDSDKLEESILELIEATKERQDFKNVTQLLNEYKKAVDSSAIVSKTDKRGVITYVNDAFCEISGYAREELLGKPHNIVRHPLTPKAVFKELWGTILSGQIWKGMIQNRKKDGGEYTVEATIVPILDTRGEVVEFIAIRYDMTEYLKMQKERELYRVKQLTQSVQKASELRLEALLAAIPHPSFILDSSDRIVAFNPKAEALFDPYFHGDWIEKLKNKELDFKELTSDAQSLFETPLDWKHLWLEVEHRESHPLTLHVPLEENRYILALSSLKEEGAGHFLAILTPLEGEGLL